MTPIDVNPNFIAPYFNGKRSDDYDEAVDIADHMTFHFDGYFLPADLEGHVRYTGKENPYFHRLIDERRPSESDTIKDYRRKNYLPITKIPCHKVANSLRKIVKSADWAIDYTKSKVPGTVPEAETLEQYCEHRYPYFGSLEAWAYLYAVNYMLKDSNAAIITIPININKDKSEFYKPYTYIIPTRDVLDYSKDEFIVYRESDYDKTKILKVITTEGIYECQRTNENYIINEILIHNLGILPVVFTGGDPIEIRNKKILYDSFLSAMLPDLDGAAQDSSDLTAEKVQHVYSTMWYFTGQECPVCNGSGNVLREGKQVVCEKCGGIGSMAKTPYKDMVLKTGAFDQQQMPTPPAGYITKPTDMVGIMQKLIADGIYNALSAINMEFLASTPLNQSGTAKEVDREELNNFVYGIAYHLVENVMKPIYKFICEWRYSNYITSPDVRAEMLPKINIPERYDLVTEKVVGTELQQAISGNFSDEIVNNLTADYVNKRFNTHPEVRDRIAAKNKLDPFSGKTTEDKQNLLLAGNVSKKDVIISLYIDHFITLAMIENKDFLTLEYAAQKAIIDRYADEKMKEMDVSEKVKRTMETINRNENGEEIEETEEKEEAAE